MAECLTQSGVFGNPSSQHHYGRQAHAHVERARLQVAQLVGAHPAQMLFTSGATESNNLAILGSVRGSVRGSAGRAHVVTASTEHRSVLDACGQLEREGHAVSYVEPDTSGLIEPRSIAAALRPETVLVSIMHANNETGVLQDVAAIAGICRAHGAPLHVDAAQSAGKLRLDVGALGADLLSFTAHKLYGPKGIGALYAAAPQRARLQPLLFGGVRSAAYARGRWRYIRSWASGAPARSQRRSCRSRPIGWRDSPRRSGKDWPALPGVLRNGHATRRVPGLLNVSFEGIEGESLLAGLSELALSSGSACDSDSEEPSHVLRSLGRNAQLAQSSLRFGLGRGTREEDMRQTVEAVRREVLRLRAVAP